MSGCNLAVVLGREFHGYIRSLEFENAGVRRSFWKGDGIAGVRAERILAGLEPEQARQGQPILFEVVDLLGFPFIK
jgi:hypothetical protein